MKSEGSASGESGEAIFTLEAGRRSESRRFESHLERSVWQTGREDGMRGTDGEEVAGLRGGEEGEEKRWRSPSPWIINCGEAS